MQYGYGMGCIIGMIYVIGMSYITGMIHIIGMLFYFHFFLNFVKGRFQVGMNIGHNSLEFGYDLVSPG